MTIEPGPAVRRRQLARELRQLRSAAGIKTLEQAAALTGLSRASISRIENGKQTILPRTVRLLCQAYGVGAPMQDHLVRLAEESEDRGWYAAYQDTMPDWFERYVAEEGDASEVWYYEAEFVPGLFQTARYIEAVTLASHPELPAQELHKLIAFRLERQQRLSAATPPKIDVVLNEAVIRRVVGSVDLMREQLRHLAALAERPNIIVRVLPFAAGAHPAMTGSFAMLHFPRGSGITTVFLEEDSGGLYPDLPAAVERYGWIYQRLRELALPPQETISLVSRVMAEL
ncbi:Helix-turn-helix domain-containing protein [Streptoalloteichus tenebrarius]|uniref:Helix-turn-helix domain-containing protein n=1 Tax=Streptoalloteichus tenebrarius (strain ATCC 17920 / DSM 40477 / JCM 4838 / CBS 697.72 / NBRC 16177 / NCIMB 11028 / NRRL B-12390 / A12253. 1 / ISP 5477) TaxID=1933 RepID=A0ABT1HLC8_STRSD|nr:helix-turn-helix transcriptional regulator [Streptoalloteichus tenebrarius]MCP2256323.1 Helix-turn-helix domain-containing protein [Streptoalloteichus tenebrarius]